MHTTGVSLQILRIAAGADPEPCEDASVRAVFELGESSFLAIYSRAPIDASTRTSSRMVATELLADIIGPQTTIRKLSELDASMAAIQLLPGSESAVSTWRSSMSSLYTQAIDSIEQEGVLCESWFSFHIEDQALLFAVMLRPTGSQHEEKCAVRSWEINRHHRAFKASWDRNLRITCRPLLSHPKIQD